MGKLQRIATGAFSVLVIMILMIAAVAEPRSFFAPAIMGPILVLACSGVAFWAVRADEVTKGVAGLTTFLAVDVVVTHVVPLQDQLLTSRVLPYLIFIGIFSGGSHVLRHYRRQRRSARN